MKDRICNTCTFYYPELSGWKNKCLHCRNFKMLNYIRDTVLLYGICEYKKEIKDE